MKSIFLPGIASATLLLSCLMASAQSKTASGKNAPGKSASQTLPPVQLRGLGALSGVFSTPAPQVSLLTITAASAPKAQLVQAKFLSDLALLPGVTTQTLANGSQKIEVHLVSGQGAIAALREGTKVRVFTAPTPALLLAQVKKAKVSATAVSVAQVKVPMWLDRWDKFGFRFYYRSWELPKGETNASYDFTKEFDFAQQQSRSGFVFWNDMLQIDSASGLMNYGWWDWAQQEARKRDLPVGINLKNDAPTWLLNQYRGETQLKMPGFTGNYHRLMSPYLGGQGSLSWNSDPAQDAIMGFAQTTVRRFAKDDNVTSFLEPHGELIHGNQDIFLEYGPVVDANYRRYLLGKYGDVAKVAGRWGMDLKSWDQVRLPEIAHFAGWGAEAFDVGGDWRVGYEELLKPEFASDVYPERVMQTSKPAPTEWFQPDFDDSSWPTINTQGDDQQLYTPKRPAVFRRNFELPADWKAKNPRVWLYVWDLNLATGDKVSYNLNGKALGTSTVKFIKPHWDAVEVTSALQAGKNSLAIRLPQGYIAYKAYLSPVPPRQYPDLGENLNAQWVDFADFTQWSRLQAAKKGMEMVRQVDGNRQITLMHPDEYSDGIKKLALDYGGNFHNTGWMGAFWGDYLNSVMRGAGLPFSLEPGGPAGDLPEFKKQLGLYQTEGIQGIDYFIHVGSILWNEDIRKHFESHRRQLELIGKYHYPKSQTAILYSDRMAQLTRYPWQVSPNTDLGGAYWQWNAAATLRGTFSYDGLTQSSFATGDATHYRVVIDSNTSVMDEAMVSDIEKWVKAGGTFVTLAQTGRHTPEKPNSWPIARLTGYKVTKIDALKEDGGIAEKGTLQAAPEQKVFGDELNGVNANGLHLEKNAADAQNLLLWNDGSVAAGVRPLGKGFIVQLGAKFTATKISDRIEPGGNNPENRQLRTMLSSLLKWRGIATEAVQLDAHNDFVMLRPAVTNNGLYDVWTLWNQSPDKAQTVTINAGRASAPGYALDARDRQRLELKAGKLENVALEPLETRVFLVPRQQLAQAPLDWFELQRQWWRGTTAPDAKPLPTPSSRFALDLTNDWKYQPVEGGAAVNLVALTDDKEWKTTRLNAWNTKERGKRTVLRKAFTVPQEWKEGRIRFWMTSWVGSTFVGKGRVWLDNREIKYLSENGIVDMQINELQPGSSHVLTVEIMSEGVMGGFRGQTWLAFEPNPAGQVDLSGSWSVSKDSMRYDATVTLPGAFEAQMLRRSVVVDEKYRALDAYLVVESEGPLIGVMVNGKLVRRFHHVPVMGNRWRLNVSPFIKYGQQNDIRLVTWEGVRKGQVREVKLGFYDPKMSS